MSETSDYFSSTSISSSVLQESDNKNNNLDSVNKSTIEEEISEEHNFSKITSTDEIGTIIDSIQNKDGWIEYDYYRNHLIDGNADYIYNLSPFNERKEVTEMKQKILKSGLVKQIDMNYMMGNGPIECLDSILLRFIQMNNHDVDKALHWFNKDIEWRKSINMKEWRKKNIEDIVGCPREVIEQHYFSRLITYDTPEEDYSPIIYRSISGLKTYDLIPSHTTVEKMTDMLLWEFEQHVDYLYDTHPQCVPIRKFKYIVDIKGMGLGQFTRELRSILSGFSDISIWHHPQRLNQLFVINAPRLFAMVWRVIQVFAAPDTRRKIQIISTPSLETDEQYKQLRDWLAMKDSLLERERQNGYENHPQPLYEKIYSSFYKNKNDSSEKTKNISPSAIGEI